MHQPVRHQVKTPTHVALEYHFTTRMGSTNVSPERFCISSCLRDCLCDLQICGCLVDAEHAKPRHGRTFRSQRLPLSIEQLPSVRTCSNPAFSVPTIEHYYRSEERHPPPTTLPIHARSTLLMGWINTRVREFRHEPSLSLPRAFSLLPCLSVPSSALS